LQLPVQLLDSDMHESLHPQKCAKVLSKGGF